MKDQTFSLASGRLRINAQCQSLDNDLLIIITGGAAHIGAIALAEPDKPAQAIGKSNHREKELAEHIAQAVAAALARPVTVCAGIHYDNIDKAEIDEILNLCAKLCDVVITIYQEQSEACMLTISHVQEFIDYLKSGKLEEDFKNGGEFQRGEILELLEKVMDAGELSDEVATRLIFRGLPGPDQLAR